MRTVYLGLTLAIGVGVAGGILAWNESIGKVSQTPAASELRSAASFAGIADQRSRSIALFEEAGKAAVSALRELPSGR
jgi:hypothetical protein